MAVGPVEKGVRRNLKEKGIRAGSAGALAQAALQLAKLLDSGNLEPKDQIAGLRELRLTVDQIMKANTEAEDEVRDLQAEAARKLS